MIMCLFTLQEQIKEFNFLELMILFFLKSKSQIPIKKTLITVSILRTGVFSLDRKILLCKQVRFFFLLLGILRDMLNFCHLFGR